jgi:hypothetical protein
LYASVLNIPQQHLTSTKQIDMLNLTYELIIMITLPHQCLPSKMLSHQGAWRAAFSFFSFIRYFFYFG